MRLKNGLLSLLAAAAVTSFTMGSAFGAATDNYPARSIRWIVPYVPGGTTDILARIMGARLGERLGQTVVVDNRPGAGGIIGVEAMSHAPPDGYTLALTGVGTLTAGPHLRKMPYDPMKDLAPITLAV